MEISPPPYTGHSAFIEPTLPEHNGDDFTPDSVQRLADARDQAAEHLPAIRQRLDALYRALDDGWCAPRGIENQIDHLSDVLSPYHLSRYLADALATLQEAEADLAIWQQMTEAQRGERWAQHEHDVAAAEERRAKIQELEARKAKIYDDMMMPLWSRLSPAQRSKFKTIAQLRTAGVAIYPELETILANITNPFWEAECSTIK